MTWQLGQRQNQFLLGLIWVQLEALLVPALHCCYH
jgi:hypothetical protein